MRPGELVERARQDTQPHDGLNCKAFVFTLVLQTESTNMVAVAPQDEAQRRSLINLRVTPRDRDLIDRAMEL